MFKGLFTDASLHMKESLGISASLFVSLAVSAAYLRMSAGKKDADAASEEKLRHRFLLVFSVCGLALLLFPGTAALMRMITGVYYDAPDMWMLIPLIPFGGFCTALLLNELRVKENIKRSAFYLGSLLLACALLLCGGLGTPREQFTGRAENATEAQKEVMDFYLEKIMNQESPEIVLASDDQIAYLHSVSADAATLYGRNMWDGRLTKNRYGSYTQLLNDIHDHMKLVLSGLVEYAPDTCKAAFENGADVIFLPVWARTEALENCGFTITVISASDGEEFMMITEGAK